MMRDLYLFDTFQGMTAASEHDTDLQGHSATSRLEGDPQRTSGVLAVAGIDEVRKNIASTSYPAERVHYIQGPVEVTIPANTPAQPIALLRLDTDWYQSTKHELLHLYSRIAPGGILMVDDLTSGGQTVLQDTRQVHTCVEIVLRFVIHCHMRARPVPAG